MHGNFWYLFGMIAYCISDYFQDTIDITTDAVNICYVAFAVLFIVDSLLYFLSWMDEAHEEKINPFNPLTAGFWAYFLNIVGSMLYLVHPVLTILDTASIDYAQQGHDCDVAAMTVFLFDSFFFAYLQIGANGLFACELFFVITKKQNRGSNSLACS